jgi:hypothetical protein
LLSLYKSRVPDPLVFGPPGSGSVTLRYGTGSGFFYHEEKLSRKNLGFYTVLLLLYDFLSLKVNVPSEYKAKKFRKKLIFCWHLEVH